MNALASLKKSLVKYSAESYFAAVEDDASRAVVAGIAEEFGWPVELIVKGGIDQMIEYLVSVPTPEILIVDLSSSSDQISDLQRLAQVCDEKVKVLALGSQNDVQLYRKVMSFGVSDYLVKPVSPEDLRDALQLLTAPAQTAANSDGKAGITAFVGARGGVGATTIAVSIAWNMAHCFNTKTALFDLDPNFGTAALMLDLEPGKGLSEALENPDRIDELFVARAMVRESDTLMVLSAEESIGNACTIDSNAVARLSGLMSENFDEIVMDVPRRAVLGDVGVLAGADRIIIVSDASLAGMRDTKQIVQTACEVAPEARVLVVVSQIGRIKDAEVALADFEAGIGRSVDFKIPYDAKSVARAIAAAEALPSAAPGGLATRELMKLTENIGDFGEPEKPGLLARFK
ncbi:MAG: AAA family ATPase, partial [Rhodospirillales bacterium]|nr:AAA family ATPase [Rhodospirillales bacterium]